jgi:quercetin dioxygenase-like cupin family protein
MSEGMPFSISRNWAFGDCYVNRRLVDPVRSEVWNRSMTEVRKVPIADVIAASGGAGRFEGKDHGSPVSFFYVTSEPGKGASKHRHPYSETFVIIDGDIEVTVDGATERMHSGTIAIIPANSWHEFTNKGDRRALMVNIHPTDEMIQENWAE